MAEVAHRVVHRAVDEAGAPTVLFAHHLALGLQRFAHLVRVTVRIGARFRVRVMVRVRVRTRPKMFRAAP